MTSEQVKRTPGPLFVGSIERTSIVRNHPNGFVLYRGFSEGDAALFAAAPDMLAALRELEEFLDNQADVDDGRPNDAMRHLVEVRAAIAKAEGRSS